MTSVDSVVVYNNKWDDYLVSLEQCEPLQCLSKPLIGIIFKYLKNPIEYSYLVFQNVAWVNEQLSKNVEGIDQETQQVANRALLECIRDGENPALYLQRTNLRVTATFNSILGVQIVIKGDASRFNPPDLYQRELENFKMVALNEKDTKNVYKVSPNIVFMSKKELGMSRSSLSGKSKRASCSEIAVNRLTITIKDTNNIPNDGVTPMGYVPPSMKSFNFSF